MSTVENVPARLPVYILTCEKSPPERVASAKAQLAALDPALDVRVIMGAVGDDAEVASSYDHRRNRRRLKRPLTPTEAAIYVGHRRVWRALLEGGAPAALVLEDDFHLRDPATVRSALRAWPDLLSAGRNIVKLFDFEKRRPGTIAFETRISDIRLTKWRSPTAGMVAYLISREGAEAFLSRQRFFRQVDEDIKYFWELGLNVWSVHGSPIVDDSANLGGSLVEGERRAPYRRGIARRLWGNLLTIDRKLRTRWYLLRERLTPGERHGSYLG